MALALVLLPLALGAGLGGALRRLRGGRFESRASSAALLLLPLLAAVVASSLAPRLGVWDSALAGAVFGLGAWGTGYRSRDPQRAKKLALGGFSTLLALALAELFVRVALPPAPPLDPADLDRVFLEDPTARASTRTGAVADTLRDPTYRALLRSALFPALDASYYEARGARARRARRRVLHLGDSMVYGLGVERREAFPALLEGLEPGVDHVNAGIPSVAPEVYLALARGWLARGGIDRVVVHFFPGNDLTELDAPYPFCSDGPLLDYATPELRTRCPTPSDGLARGDLRGLLLRSPPPYLLRQAGRVSSLAERVSLSMLAVRARASRDAPWSEPVAWQHLERILRALRDETAARRVPLALVVLPVRQSLEAFDPSLTEGDALRLRALELARRLGITVWDPWELFRGAAQREGVAPWFASAMPRDLHFSAAGHALLARWLHDALREEP